MGLLFMKKLAIFHVFALVFTTFSAVSATSFSCSFFDSHLEYRLNRDDLSSEFKDWPIVIGRSMREVFNTEMTHSDELRKMYYYFRGPINKMYDNGIFSDTMSHQSCVECIKCNIDIIIDLLRKSIISHTQKIAEEQPTQLDVTIDVPEEVAFQMLEDELNGDLETPSQPVVVQEPVIHQEPQVEDMSDIFEDDFDDDDGDDPILESYYEHHDEHIHMSEEDVDHQLEALADEPTFEERFRNAIRSVEGSRKPIQHQFVDIAVHIVGRNSANEVTTQELLDLNRELDDFINARIMPEKEWQDYTWKEKLLARSPFACVRERLRKRILQQRVIEENKPWVRLALNIKVTVANGIIERSRYANQTNTMRRLFNERRDAFRLASDLV